MELRDALFLSKDDVIYDICNLFVSCFSAYLNITMLESENNYTDCDLENRDEFFNTFCSKTKQLSVHAALLKDYKYYSVVFKLKKEYVFINDFLDLIINDTKLSLFIYKRMFYGLATSIDIEEFNRLMNLSERFASDFREFVFSNNDLFDTENVSFDLEFINNFSNRFEWMLTKYSKSF